MRWKLFTAVGSLVLALSVGGYAIYTHSLKPASVLQANNAIALANAPTDETFSDENKSDYDLTAHQTLSRVILLIRENYVEPDRIKPYDMFLAALDYIQKTVPEVIVDDTQAPKRVVIYVKDESRTFELNGLDQLWAITMALRDIFEFLQSQITDPELRRDIEYAAINGMLSTLDPHSILLKPENFDDVKVSTKGEFGGLGIVISIRDGALTVISPIEGTPASRAGLKAQDAITKIGEESTVNMNLEEAVQRLRGKPGSKVNIWVLRKKWTEAKKFQLSRAIIKINSVDSKLLSDNVGYLRIKSFQNNTFDDLNTHLQKLRNDNHGQLKGLVLDLRNNPGGLLDQAILVSDRFIENGPIVITVGEGNKRREVKMAHAAGTDTSYPIVVLVNGGSASASEIVAGALKNHNRAVILGDSTFGKGSVQVLYDFKDNSALKLTIAQYLTPGDISIQSVGIVPDIQIIPASISKERIHLFAQNMPTREKDLIKHLDQHQGSPILAQKSAVNIVHLEEPDAEETSNKTEVKEEEEPAPDTIKMDYEIGLAKDLLVHAQSLERQAIIDQAKALFDANIAKEQNQISSRLKTVGTDWADGVNQRDAINQLQVEFVVPQKPAQAGQTITLQAHVKNVGKTPLYRIFGITQSDNPLFKNLEFVFGRIDPGMTKSWDINIKLPKDLNTQAANVVLGVGDSLHPELVKSPAFVHLEEVNKPRFAYVYRLLEGLGGNGDGVLQVGEKVRLSLDIQNLGPGISEDTTVTVKNLAGQSVFLDRGRQKLGILKVGETKTADLSFTLRTPLETGDQVKFRLGVFDTVLGSSLSEVFNVPVVDARLAKPAKQFVKIARNDTPLYAGAHTATPILAYAKMGTVLKSDTAYAGWLRVQLGKDKFGYVASEATSPSPMVKVLGKNLKMLNGHTAPEITLDLAQLITENDNIDLSGKITDDEHIKDIFVFVNDKKVYYHSLEHLKDEAAQGITFPLHLSLPLKSGTNGVAVVVRENDDLITRKIFAIYRNDAKAKVATPTQVE